MSSLKKKIFSKENPHPNPTTDPQRRLRNLRFVEYVKSGDLSRVSKELPFIDIDFVDPDTSRSVLTLAVEANHPEMVSTLLTRKPKLNCTNGKGNTPLMIAVELNYQKIIKLLVETHNDNCISHSNREGKTAIDLALDVGKDKVAMYLIDKGCDTRSSLLAAIEKNDWPRIEWLAKNKADLNIVDPYRYSPLVSAFMDENLDAFSRWIALGANVNFQGGNGRDHSHEHKTPFMLSIMYGKNSFSEKLIDAPGFDPNIQDEEGANAAFWAVRSEDSALLKKLLSLKVKMDLFKSNGASILMEAIIHNNFDAMKYILEKGLVGANSADRNNVTPLMYAIQKASVNAVEILANYPLDLNAQTKKQKITALGLLRSKVAALPPDDAEMRARYKVIYDLLDFKKSA
ncbi:MAG: ankyrin repeat domain-containing protein [Bdellovibrionales bacterium]|nr:ankyrin repeat domain-containing protein [Bdellovibrionales bacterium]